MKTLRDFIDEDGYIDIDVWDTEIDMGVAFVYSKFDPKDNYGRFLECLLDVSVKNVVGDHLVVDFSGFFEPHKKTLWEFYKNFLGHVGTEFGKSEIHYDFVIWLEGWVAGYSGDTTYGLLADMMETW